MRQYRAWHKAEKVMCEVSLINFDKGAFLVGVKPGKDEICDKSIIIAPCNGRFCDWDEIELMESTGLKDKDGVEIYEGDIISDDCETKYLIVFKGGCFYGQYDENDAEGDIDISNKFSPIEVIGNIRQNPDLV